MRKKKAIDTSRSPPRLGQDKQPSGISPRDGLAPPSTFSAGSVFVDKDQNVPENEAGVKATTAKQPDKLTDKELFGAEDEGDARFLTDELNKQYHEHLRRKEEIR